MALKRLSSTRKRHATPSLSLQATKSTVSAPVRKPIPFEEEDDDGPPPLDNDMPPAPTTLVLSPKKSQPLQEISPNLSPHKTRAQVDDSKSKVAAAQDVSLEALSRDSPMPVTAPQSPKSPLEPPKPETQQPLARQPEEATAELASLMRQQFTSRPDSASSEPLPQKRKTRPLGRNLSGISNRSASASAPSDNTSPAITEGAADGYTSFSSKEVVLPPSTQLGYENPEAEALRRQMGRQMGLELGDEAEGRRVKGLGMVRDAVVGGGGEAGVGGRMKVRGRGKEGGR